MTNSQKLKIAQDMLEAWENLEWESVYQLFGEDGVLSNMMTEPVIGADAIKARFTAFEQGLNGWISRCSIWACWVMTS